MLTFFTILFFLGMLVASLFEGSGTHDGSTPPYVPPEPPTRHWCDGYNYNPGPGPYGGGAK